MSLFNFFKKKEVPKLEIHAPVSGEIIKIEDVDDPVFSGKMVGDGFAILPKEDKEAKFFAPFTGKLVTVFETGHAYGISDKLTKIECLVHIGIDTVELNGKGFDIKVKQDDQVNVNELLVIVDLKSVIKQGKKIVTPIIFTNETLEPNYKINILKIGKVQQGEIVAEIVRK